MTLEAKEISHDGSESGCQETKSKFITRRRFRTGEGGQFVGSGYKNSNP